MDDSENPSVCQTLKEIMCYLIFGVVGVCLAGKVPHILLIYLRSIRIMG